MTLELSVDADCTLGLRELDAEHFTEAQCDALFAAILIDDDVDDDAQLPATIQLDYSRDELASCFRLCRQLWYAGLDRATLIDLSAKLISDRDLGAADRVRFKHIRAKFKHFRYAFALCGEAHRYPRMLDRITITMGHLQDAYRIGRRAVVLREALLFRLLLSRLPLRLLYREAARLQLTTSASFRTMLERDVAALAGILTGDAVTGHHFHVTRKVIGRQVSFWNTLQTIAPSTERFDMTRTLSAINGLMGDMHDRLVEQRGDDPASYGRSFVLPDEIRDRIAALLGVYRAACQR